MRWCLTLTHEMARQIHNHTLTRARAQDTHTQTSTHPHPPVQARPLPQPHGLRLATPSSSPLPSHHFRYTLANLEAQTHPPTLTPTPIIPPPSTHLFKRGPSPSPMGCASAISSSSPRVPRLRVRRDLSPGASCPSPPRIPGAMAGSRRANRTWV